MVLQVAQGIGDSWGMSAGNDISLGAERSEGWSSLAEGDQRAAVH